MYDQTSGSIPDFGFLPPNFNGDVQVFGSDNNAQGSFKWVKPRGVTMCYMMCIGGGGGGGGGLTGATTTARGGGGGGAASGISVLQKPAIFLPDVLLVQVGNGGVGKGSGSAGNAGTNSIISFGSGITAINALPNIILQSNNAAAGGGAAGTGAGAANGGSVPTISTAALSGASIGFALPAYLVGLVGGAGGTATGAVGASPTGWNTINVSGGGGGAGVNSVNTSFAGGAINLTSNTALDFADGLVFGNPAIAGGVAGASGTGAAGNGNAGVQLWKPFYMTGGSGGGSSDANIGGNGGDGGIGCGGGGGGAGTTGGTGGNGGNGFVCIISW